MKKLIGEVSKEQIEEWKKAHGDIFQLTADGKAAYIRKPKREEISLSMSYYQTNPLMSTEAILQACWLGGCDELQTNDAYFLGINQQIQSIIETANVEVKKL